MKRRLGITMKSEDLKRRIDESIVVEEANMAALDARIDAREGDKPYDVRVEDGLKSLEELETERRQISDRVTQLTLLRDSLVPNDVYALGKDDLRYAGIISPDRPDPPDFGEGDWVDCGTGLPVDGLRLTFSGEELRTLLEARQREHERRAARWKHELTRTPEDATEDKPLLPDQMCENEAQEEAWRAKVMAFIRDHLEPDETYRLGQADLEFGELLPEKPGWMKQMEYEERTGVAFNLERIAKRL